MSGIADQVREFHEAYDCAIGQSIHAPGLAELRMDLIAEEVDELYNALFETPDIVEVADALGDIAYVVYGAALAFGIDLDAVVDEIHRSNMSKLGTDGKPIYRHDGKVLKGENYFPPDIARVLGIDNEGDNA